MKPVLQVVAVLLAVGALSQSVFAALNRGQETVQNSPGKERTREPGV